MLNKDQENNETNAHLNSADAVAGHGLSDHGLETQDSLSKAKNKDRSSAASIRHRPLLSELEKIATSCLTKVLNQSLDSADDALFEHSEKAENSNSQSSFFGTMREIRVKREAILEAFTQSISGFFSSEVSNKNQANKASAITLGSDALSLMADDDLEISVAVDSIVGKCQRQFSNLLPSLSVRFESANNPQTRDTDSPPDPEKIPDEKSSNPVSPENICQSFEQALSVLEADVPVLIVIYKLFERSLLQDIGNLYEALNAKLIQNKILVEYIPSHLAKEEQQQLIAQEKQALENVEQLVDQAVSSNVGGAAPGTIAQSAANFASIAHTAGMSPVGQFFAGNLTSQSFPGMEISPSEIQLANEMAQLLVYLPKLGQMSGHSENTQRIGQTMERMDVSETPAIGYEALLHLLNKLQHQQVDIPQSAPLDDSSVAQEIPASPHQVLENLSDELVASSESEDHSIGHSERDTIGLVSMLFQFIIDDRVVSKVMCRTLGRLQLPIIKVALKDPRFFSNSSHPARVFLNNITSASVSWAESDTYESDPFYIKILNYVDKIVDEFDDDLSLFDELTEKLSEFIESDKARVEKSKQRLVDAEIGKDKTYAIRSFVERLIESKLRSSTPEFVSDLLRKELKDYLVRIVLQEGEESQNFQNAVTLLDDLMWSIAAQRYKADYQDVLQKIPVVIRGLKKSFKALQIERDQSVRFFKKLAIHHKSILMRESPLQVNEPEHQVPDVFQQAASTLFADVAEGQKLASNSGAQSNSTTPASNSSADINHNEVDGAAAANEVDSYEQECIDKAKRLAVGQWVEVDQEEDKLRCRLAAILRASGKRVFVNRRGVKALDMPLEELIERIKAETLTLLDDNQLFDKALSTVIGDLKDQRRETVAV